MSESTIQLNLAEKAKIAIGKYRDLVEEAYISPIRSVLIIDDAFPTLEGLLNNSVAKNEIDIDRLKRLISQCRKRDTGWLVDVHDGNEVAFSPETNNLSHLHQSDLLILDYHLDGDERNDKAIKILQKLASNDHFNLVVVYTNGYKGSELAQVGHEIARALTQITVNVSQRIANIPEKISEWEDDDQDIVARLLDLIDLPTAIRTLNLPDSKWSTIKNVRGLDQLRQFIEERQIAEKVALNDVGEWLLAKKLESWEDLFSSIDNGYINFSDQQNNVWIRSDKIFVTVVGKETPPEEIVSKLIDSLVDSCPSPHRLLMTKIRGELDTYGVGAETVVLDKRHVQAGWMHQMLTSNQLERPWRIRHTTNRHWEQMADAIQINVQSFAQRLCEIVLQTGSPADIVKKHTGLDLNVPSQSKSVTLHLNSFVCSKEIEGHHLMPGHILRLYGGDKPEYWLCLSPACDLVPGQSQRWGKNRAEGIMPFKAVLLEEISTDKALKGANSNDNVFVSIDNEIKTFGFTTANGNPKWEQMFALDSGNIAPQTFMLGLERILVSNGILGIKLVNAKIVAQLRYEYALNLLGRLGTSLSRVGLDFVHHD